MSEFVIPWRNASVMARRLELARVNDAELDRILVKLEGLLRDGQR